MAYWYLDNEATGTNAGTSWTDAWEGFSEIVWASVNAGDTIYISGGTTSKTYKEQLTVGKNGSVGSIITISVSSDAGHNGTVIIDGEDSRNYCIYAKSYGSYVTIYGGSWKLKCVNYVLCGAYMDERTSCVFDGIWCDQGEGRGFQTDEGVSCYIRNCKTISPADSPSETDGIYGQYNNGNIYEGNWIGIYNEGAEHNDCMQFYQETGATIRNNYCEQVDSKLANAQGIYGTTLHGTIRVYNNVIYNYTGTNAIGLRNLVDGDASFEVLNNTCVVGGYHGIYTSECADPVIKNNIVYHSGLSGGYTMSIYNWSGTDDNIDYNCHYHLGSATVCNYGGTGKTWAQWQALGFDAHGINVDPDLTVDYEPQVASPVVDVGADLSGTFTTDKNGVTRPLGDGWDIGAYEYDPVVNITDTISWSDWIGAQSPAEVTKPSRHLSMVFM